MTGQLRLTSANYPQLRFVPNSGGGAWVEGINTKISLNASQDDTNNNRRILNVYNASGKADRSAALTLTEYADGSNKGEYKIYGEHNKPTFADIAFLGNDPITSTADDTTVNWKALGSGFARYDTTGMLNGQPSQYGLMLSITSGSDIFQLWKVMSTGALYVRSGSNSGWGQSWTKIFDANHKPTAANVAAGTFAGQVVANSSGQAVGTSLLRNSKLVSADTNPTVNGEINWTYG